MSTPSGELTIYKINLSLNVMANDNLSFNGRSNFHKYELHYKLEC
jgi:hypothetical protein